MGSVGNGRGHCGTRLCYESDNSTTYPIRVVGGIEWNLKLWDGFAIGVHVVFRERSGTSTLEGTEEEVTVCRHCSARNQSTQRTIHTCVERHSKLLGIRSGMP